ncbi:MAG: YdcF family protein [Bacteroidales bacterium]
MYFVISKLFYFLLTPVIWFIALLIFALVAQNNKRRRRILIISTVFIYVISNSFIVNEAVKAWEVQTVHVDSLASYKYGIVLGGFNTYDPYYERVNFNKASDRLWQALLLYKKGIIHKILISGGEGRIIKQGYAESDITKDFLIQLGIPAYDIVVENKSRNTYENALYTARKLGSEKYSHRCLLITSAIHMKRAEACFAHAGVQCDMFSTDRIAGHTKFIFDYCFIPSFAAIENWRLLIREMVGFVVYRVNGYI